MLYTNFLCLLYLMVFINGHSISKSVIENSNTADEALHEVTNPDILIHHPLKSDRIQKHRSQQRDATAKLFTPKKLTTVRSNIPEKFTFTKNSLRPICRNHQKSSKKKSFWDRFRGRGKKKQHKTTSKETEEISLTDEHRKSRSAAKIHGAIQKSNNKRKHYIQNYHEIMKSRKYMAPMVSQDNKYEFKIITDITSHTPNLKSNKQAQMLEVNDNSPKQLNNAKDEVLDRFSKTPITESVDIDNEISTLKLSSVDCHGTAQIEQLLDYIKANTVRMVSDENPAITGIITNAVSETSFFTDPILKHLSANLRAIKDTNDKKDLESFTGNVFKDSVVTTNTEPYNTRFARTIKQEALEIAQTMEDKLEKELKKVYDVLKKKVSESIDKMKTATLTKSTKPVKKLTTAPCTKPVTTKPMVSKTKVHTVKPVSKHGRKQRNQKVKLVTYSGIQNTEDDYALLEVYEEMLKKAHQNIAGQVLTTEPNFTRQRKRVKVSKRDAETVPNKPKDFSKNYEDKIPNYENNMESNLSKRQKSNHNFDSNKATNTLEHVLVAIKNNVDSLYNYDEDVDTSPEKYAINIDKMGNVSDDLKTTKSMATSANYDETSYEGLSNKICYNDFVNGYKHYLKFQKEQGDGNFSAQVKYQAHKHHKVDDIGKYILKKLPEIPTDEINKYKTSRDKRFFDDTYIDDQEVSTKSDDSWFKKHFYFFIDNGPPKKFHTVQTVSFTSPESHYNSCDTHKTYAVEPKTRNENSLRIGNNSENTSSNFFDNKPEKTTDATSTLFNIDFTKSNKMTLDHLSESLHAQSYPEIPSMNDGTTTTYDYMVTADIVTAGQKFIHDVFNYKPKKNILRHLTTQAKEPIEYKVINKNFTKYGNVGRNKRTPAVKEKDSMSKDIVKNTANKGETLQDTTQSDKNCKKCYIHIDLVPKATSVLKLQEHTTNRSRLKQFFKKFHLKKQRAKKKDKRQLPNEYQNRKARFNPLKKLKKIFKIKFETTTKADNLCNCNFETRTSDFFSETTQSGTYIPKSQSYLNQLNSNQDYFESPDQAKQVKSNEVKPDDIPISFHPGSRKSGKAKNVTKALIKNIENKKLKTKEEKKKSNINKSKLSRNPIRTTARTRSLDTSQAKFIDHQPSSLRNLQPLTIYNSFENEDPSLDYSNYMEQVLHNTKRNRLSRRFRKFLKITDKSKENIFDLPKRGLTVKSKSMTIEAFPLEPVEVDNNVEVISVKGKWDSTTERLTPVQNVKIADGFETAHTHKYFDFFNKDISNFKIHRYKPPNNKFKDRYYNKNKIYDMKKLLEDSKTVLSNINNEYLKENTKNFKLKDPDEGVLQKLRDRTPVTNNLLVIRGEEKYIQSNKLHPYYTKFLKNMIKKSDKEQYLQQPEEPLPDEFTTENPTILTNTSVLAYDDETESVTEGLDFRKMYRSSQTIPVLKKAQLSLKTKVYKQPVHYYATPVPMTSESFERFLKDNNLDVEFVTKPLLNLSNKDTEINLNAESKKPVSNDPQTSKSPKPMGNRKNSATKIDELKQNIPKNKTANHTAEKKLLNHKYAYTHVNQIKFNDKNKRNIKFLKFMKKRNKVNQKSTIENFQMSDSAYVTTPNALTKEIEITIINVDKDDIPVAVATREIPNSLTTKPQLKTTSLNRKLKAKHNKKLNIDVKKFVMPVHNGLLYRNAWDETSAYKVSRNKKEILLPKKMMKNSRRLESRDARRSSDYDGKDLYGKPLLEYLERNLSAPKLTVYEYFIKSLKDVEASTEETECPLCNHKHVSSIEWMKETDKEFNNLEEGTHQNILVTVTNFANTQNKMWIEDVDQVKSTLNAEVRGSNLQDVEINSEPVDFYKLFNVPREKMTLFDTDSSSHQGTTKMETEILKPHQYLKRDIVACEKSTFTAKNVAALDIILDLVKNPNVANTEKLDFSNISTHSQVAENFTTKPDANMNSIQIHLALPNDIQTETKRSLPKTQRIRKIFSAKISSPVDLEYQIKSFEATPEPTKSTQNTVHELSPGMYFLLNKGSSGYVLQPVRAKIDSDIHARQANITTDAKNSEAIPKVYLTKDILTAINKKIGHLSQLRKKRHATKVLKTPKDYQKKQRINDNDSNHGKYICKRKINWGAVKRYFGHDRVCNCKCKPNVPMCRACAVTDAVIDELIFEFDNIGKYINDHCTEIQTFFWMNPSGGMKLRDSVQRIEKSLHDYYKRVKGKCKGKTCNALATYMDKRSIGNIVDLQVVKKDDTIKHLAHDLNSIGNDLNQIVALNTCFNPKLKGKGENFMHTIAKCTKEKKLKKRNSFNSQMLDNGVKTVYSLDNVNVNIICSPESSTPQQNLLYAKTESDYAMTIAPIIKNNIAQSTEDMEDMLTINFKKQKKLRRLKNLFPWRTTFHSIFMYYSTETPKTQRKRSIENKSKNPTTTLSDVFWKDFLKGKLENRFVKRNGTNINSLNGTKNLNIKIEEKNSSNINALDEAKNFNIKFSSLTDKHNNTANKQNDYLKKPDSFAIVQTTLRMFFENVTSKDLKPATQISRPVEIFIHTRPTSIKSNILFEGMPISNLSKTTSTIKTTKKYTNKPTVKTQKTKYQKADTTRLLDNTKQTMLKTNTKEKIKPITKLKKIKTTTGLSSVIENISTKNLPNLTLLPTNALPTIANAILPKNKDYSELLFRKPESDSEITTKETQTDILKDWTSDIHTTECSLNNETNPNIIIINNCAKLAIDNNFNDKSGKYKDLLLSIIEYESKKLNEEWRRVAKKADLDSRSVSSEPSWLNAATYLKTELVTVKIPTVADVMKDKTNKHKKTTKKPLFDRIANKIRQSIKSIEYTRDVSHANKKRQTQHQTQRRIIYLAVNKSESVTEEDVCSVVNVMCGDEGDRTGGDQNHTAGYKGDNTGGNQGDDTSGTTTYTEEQTDSLSTYTEEYQTNSTPATKSSLSEAKELRCSQICDLSAAYSHTVYLFEHLSSPSFKKYVKNIPCSKRRTVPELIIRWGKEDAILWDWIRSKRSMNRYVKQRILKGIHDERGYERFVRGSNGIYKMSRRKREIGVESLESGLRRLPALTPNLNEMYVMSGENVTLDCCRGKDGCTWTADQGLLRQPNVKTVMNMVVITEVDPMNYGNYICKQDFQIQKIVTLSVVKLPAFDVVFLSTHRTPENCSYDDLKAMKFLGSAMARAMNCQEVCSIRIYEPVCLGDKDKKRSLAQAIGVLSVHPPLLSCGVECKRDMLSSFVYLAAENVPLLYSKNVTIVANGRRKNKTLQNYRGSVDSIVTLRLKKKDSTGQHKYRGLLTTMSPGDIDVVIACPAGYYLLRNQNLCAACPPNTKSSEGENRCVSCPPGTSSRAGASLCQHTVAAPRRYDWWWYPPCGYVVACGGVAGACCGCVALSLMVQLVSRNNDKAPRSGENEKTKSAPRARPMSPSRVILARFFKPSLSSSRATDSQETKFELWKERNIPPPLPPIDFDS